MCLRKVRLKIFSVQLSTISRDSASALEFLQATRAILIVSVNLVTQPHERTCRFRVRFMFYLENFIYSILGKRQQRFRRFRKDNEIKVSTYTIKTTYVLFVCIPN